MLDVSLEHSRYVCGSPAELVFHITNKGPGLLTNVLVRLALPAGLLLLDGEERINLVRLLAGTTAKHTLNIQPQQAGTWLITSPNCSYRDAQGQSHRISDLQLRVHVVPPAPAPPAQAQPKPLRPAEIALLHQKLSAAETKLASCHRRLQPLEKQKIYYGVAVNPGVLMEIEDICQEIDRLEAEIKGLRAQLGE